MHLNISIYWETENNRSMTFSDLIKTGTNTYSNLGNLQLVTKRAMPLHVIRYLMQ